MIVAHICESPAYRYGGWYFEVHSYHGPAPLNADGSVKATNPKGEWPMTFWWTWEEFSALSKEEQERHRAP